MHESALLNYMNIMTVNKEALNKPVIYRFKRPSRFRIINAIIFIVAVASILILHLID